jgi:hypothetical protein
MLIQKLIDIHLLKKFAAFHETQWLITVFAIAHQGCAVAQAVGRWLPTTAARVCVQAACGFCGEQSGTGAGFLRVLRFLLPIIIPQISLTP